jgi:prepilin-type N-terminal cleavage/methylation domain-containing protein
MTARYRNMSCRRTGFTLIEMAVVLVIIALILGSIITVQSMITRAQVRAVIGEYDRYIKAVKEFEDKFATLPGDMPNATDFWGVQSIPVGGCPNGILATTDIPLDTATCNGNGDGRIGYSDENGSLGIFVVDPSGVKRHYETWRAWQHLANAGLLDGRYTGRYTRNAEVGTGQGTSVPGINVPGSEIKTAGWSLTYYQDINGWMYTWPDSYGHIMSYGGQKTDYITADAGITASQASEIDRKIDDSHPAYGKVRAWRSLTITGGGNCTTSEMGGRTTLEYRYASKGIKCSLIFITGF